jgi:tetratricopeptide (TPR) repeat protein
VSAVAPAGAVRTSRPVGAARVAAWRLAAVAAGLVGADDAALAWRERVAAARPDDPTALATVAHLRAARGEDAAAVALLRASVDLDPMRAAGWYNLGFLLQRRGENEAALDAFGRALVLDPSMDLAHYGRALSLIRCGRLEAAIEPLRRTIALQPMSPYGYYQLAHVHHKLGDAARVARLVERLAAFEPQVAARLARETGVAAAGDEAA